MYSEKWVIDRKRSTTSLRLIFGRRSTELRVVFSLKVHFNTADMLPLLRPFVVTTDAELREELLEGRCVFSSWWFGKWPFPIPFASTEARLTVPSLSLSGSDQISGGVVAVPFAGLFDNFPSFLCSLLSKCWANFSTNVLSCTAIVPLHPLCKLESADSGEKWFIFKVASGATVKLKSL